VIDDTELERVMLVVVFVDRTERWGPSARSFAESVKALLDADPPKGYVSSKIVVGIK
jgi:hypothetical protein